MLFLTDQMWKGGCSGRTQIQVIGRIPIHSGAALVIITDEVATIPRFAHDVCRLPARSSPEHAFRRLALHDDHPGHPSI
jgi:hypothetical protein